jgi:hypothetical protein
LQVVIWRADTKKITKNLDVLRRARKAEGVILCQCRQVFEIKEQGKLISLLLSID